MMMMNILWCKQGYDLIQYDDMYGKKYDEHCKSYGDNYGKTCMAKNDDEYGCGLQIKDQVMEALLLYPVVQSNNVWVLRRQI